MIIFVKRWFITIFNANVNMSLVFCKVGIKLLNIKTTVTRNFIPQILLNVQDLTSIRLATQVMTKASSDLRQTLSHVLHSSLYQHDLSLAICHHELTYHPSGTNFLTKAMSVNVFALLSNTAMTSKVMAFLTIATRLSRNHSNSDRKFTFLDTRHSILQNTVLCTLEVPPPPLSLSFL
jgi:hypothetical protein